MNKRLMTREDIAALTMNTVQLDTHLSKRLQQIEALDKENTKLKHAIDAINMISGRASTGHDKECECSYCIIHRITFKAWQAN